MTEQDTDKELQALKARIAELEAKRRGASKVSKDGGIRRSTAFDPQIASLKDSIDSLTKSIDGSKMSKTPKAVKEANEYHSPQKGGILGAFADLKDGIERMAPKKKKQDEQR